MPKHDEAATEAEIQSKGLNAPRLSPAHIDAQIIGEYFHLVPGTSFMICVLTLKNGFKVTGESRPASDANFDAALGKRIARDNARNKIWELEGYALRSWLHATKAVTPPTMRAKVRVGSLMPYQAPAVDSTQMPETVAERLVFHAVCKTGGYGEDGLDENNTFAKFSPSVFIDMNVANPELFGKFEAGDTFYLDFIPAPK